MSTNPRDTQFAGFAGLLLEQLLNVEGVYVESSYGEVRTLWEPIIAQRAYDLVAHAVNETIGISKIDHVPDLIEWPKESE
jgi:hypothetical protein